MYINYHLIIKRTFVNTFRRISSSPCLGLLQVCFRRLSFLFYPWHNHHWL